MKLIQKSNRYFLFILLGAFMVMGLVLYLMLYYFIVAEINEKLSVDEQRIIHQLNERPEINNLEPITEIHVTFKSNPSEPVFNDVYIYDPIEGEDELFRELRSVRVINDITYEIKIRHSLIETTDIMLAIGISIFLIIILLVVVVLLINRKLSKKLWSPFYHNINELQNFSLETLNTVKLRHSDVEEFENLRLSLEKLTDKIIRDYKALKEFTENASHEIQTPLAVMMLNLEEVMQKELDKGTYTKVYSSYKAAQRLSKLNEKLLLLTKLENHQYNNVSSLNFSDLIKEKTEELLPLIEEQGLVLNTELDEPFLVEMDSLLANILITNLLSNAIKYNLKGGEINIITSVSGFKIENTTDNIVDDHVFERFVKSGTSSESTGLGLAIVMKIISYYGFEISVSQSEIGVVFTIENK